MAWVAPVHMKAASTASHTTLVMSPPNRRSTTGARTRTNRPRAITRPAHAAAMVDVPGRLVTLQMTARSIRPPSRGSPGSRLNAPTTRLPQPSRETSEDKTASEGEITRVRP